MEDANTQPKWKGKECVELGGAKAEEVWPFFADFCNLNKWFPTLSTCVRVEGVEGQPGCVRYCAGFKTHIEHSDVKHVNWTKQKLLSIEPDNMALSYSIIDGNVGFNSYVSKMRVLPRVDGCAIEWEYEVEPVEGWKPKDLEAFVSNGLNIMAKRMKEALELGVLN
ncbi:hypothetical protein BVRB_8g197230 [Beta vulgaris subsp. vulgaris]|nr:hypothetical protein BVRB_8g197230 [Beta vulgaris subsp. vulgaris]